ncbi:hypothetical protein N7454_003219 [Penicillium verhagenii]|nr:hypothetical protein N7454_003219 [Penicillium verhagenii]
MALIPSTADKGNCGEYVYSGITTNPCTIADPPTHILQIWKPPTNSPLVWETIGKMKDGDMHSELGRFNLVLEESTVSVRYRVKTFRNSILRLHMPEFVTLESPDSRYPSPNRLFLALHTAIGNVLHATSLDEQS